MFLSFGLGCFSASELEELYEEKILAVGIIAAITGIVVAVKRKKRYAQAN